LRALNAPNLAIRFFVVELGGLAASAYWGWEFTSGPGRWYLAAAAPIAFIAVWGLFIAPKARVQVSKPAAFAIELALVVLVAVGLGSAGPVWLGVSYAVVALVSGVLNFALKD